jgi:uncharacterized protein YjiS (DUF1127 family)
MRSGAVSCQRLLAPRIRSAWWDTAVHPTVINPNSWPRWAALLSELLHWSERSRQRAAFRDLADDRHLLNDLGLTRQEALDEANRPFWE